MPIPPGFRDSGAVETSGSGARVGSKGGAVSIERDDDPIADQLGGHVEIARAASVAVDRDVGRGLVDRLHELVHADLGSAATGRHLTHERADVGQAIEIGRDGQVAAGVGGHVGGHAIRAYSAGARLTNWP